MPPVSQAQRRAMFAAKEGKSTLGIPQEVGAKFVAADPGGKMPKTAGLTPHPKSGLPRGGSNFTPHPITKPR